MMDAALALAQGYKWDEWGGWMDGWMVLKLI